MSRAKAEPREKVVAPYSEDAEIAVLGGMLLDAKALRTGLELLTPGDFYVTAHRLTFGAITALADKGEAIDPITLREALEARGELDAAGGRTFVSYLFDMVPTGDHVAYHAAIVREKSARRKWIDTLRESAKALSAGDDLEAVDMALERRLSALRLGVKDSRVFDDKQAMAQAALDFLLDEGAPGTPYGFSMWDAAVLPALTGHLVLIGGASGSGKSTVARNVCRNHVQRYERTAGLLTPEMTGEEQLVLLACMDVGIPVEDYYRRRFTPEKAKAFHEALMWWKDTPRLKVNEMGSLTPERALRIFKRWREQGVTHFYLDHLHRLDYGASKSGDDLRVPIAAFARELKNFAKDSEATVYALVQYTKIKPHTEPDDSNIREANQILEEADAVFHIYQPLVVCDQHPDGFLSPRSRQDGTRIFEHDAAKGDIVAPDNQRVYVKLGKQRRRTRHGLVSVPFNAWSGLMYDSHREEPHLRLERGAA